MMEEELRQLLKEHGLSLYKGKRSKRIYLYAVKFGGKQIYLAPLLKLPQLTKEEVLKKIS